MKNDVLYYYHVDGYGDEWYICLPDGTREYGPYKRAQDAKAQLTILKKDNNIE